MFSALCSLVFLLFILTLADSLTVSRVLVRFGGPVNMTKFDCGPIAGLMVEPQELQLLRQVCRELFVLRAAVLPMSDWTNLVKEFTLLHRVTLQVNKEPLVHVCFITVVRNDHDAVVFMQRHRH